MIRQPLLLSGLIAAITALSLWLDYRYARLSKIGASLLAILFGAAFSNTELVPASSPVYDVVTGPVTYLAIAWLLLAVDLSDIRRAGPRMIGAFALASFGTAAGAFAGAALYSAAFDAETWKLAGVFTGTYIGGSVNFVAIGRAVDLGDSLFAGATAADNVTTAIWLGATLALPIWLSRFFVPPPSAIFGDGVAAAAEGGRHAHHPIFSRLEITPARFALLLATGAVLVAAADFLGGLVPGIPSVLWLTTLALLAGNLTPLRGTPGALQLGAVTLTAFFVVIGIFSRVSEILVVGVEVFFFTLVIVLVHGAVVFGAGRLLRLDAPTLAVASQAAVGGPSSALAVAVSREWRGLVLPGVIVGLLGYAIGTYIGLLVAWSVRALGW
jgi:uncharacterized membrane protein